MIAMHIVRSDSLESIEHYGVVEVDTPRPRPGEVLVRVAACGVGYVDALLATGAYQVKPPLPYVPGQEIAGWVEALGEGVSAFKPGDRVLATVYGGGGFAEYVAISERLVHAMPEAMSFAQAAGFRLNYVTALYGLRLRGGLQTGERLLVTGAAGGLGSAAVQVGRLLGAEVVAVASSASKRDFALSLGADHALDTEPEGWRDRLKAITGSRGVDVVFDPVCGPLFQLAFRSLAWGGRHLVAGFAGGPIPALPANLSLMKGAALIGVDVRQFTVFELQRETALFAELLAWVGEGRLVPPVGKTFTFSAYREALQFALSGQAMGKTILEIAHA